jgi:hypothetical protein
VVKTTLKGVDQWINAVPHNIARMTCTDNRRDEPALKVSFSLKEADVFETPTVQRGHYGRFSFTGLATFFYPINFFYVNLY